MSRGVAALATLLLLAGCASLETAQARAFATGYRAGDTIRYRLHTTLSGSLLLGAQQIPLNSDQTLTELISVVSVDEAGTATIKVTTEDVAGDTSASPGPATLVIASDGRIKSGAATQLTGRVPSIPGSDQLTPVLSGKAVRPGDSWDKEYSRPNPFGAGGFSLTAHNSYARDETVAGHAAAIIDTALKGPVDFTIDFSRLPASGASPAVAAPVHYSGSINSSRRYWVDLTDHQVLRSTGSGSYRLSYAITVPTGQAGGPQQVDFNGSIKSELTRI
jgi:hypothetical protein